MRRLRTRLANSTTEGQDWDLDYDINELPTIEGPTVSGDAPSTMSSADQASLGSDLLNMLTTPWGGVDGFIYGIECFWQCGLPGDGSLEANLMALGPIGAVSSNLARAGSIGTGGLRSVGRFFYDPRSYSVVSREYWAKNGPALGRSLHHWLIPQRASWVPEGIRNAGFNLFELQAYRGVFHRTLDLNTWMGFARNWGPTAARQAAQVEGAIRIGVPAATGAMGYAGYEFGSTLREP